MGDIYKKNTIKTQRKSLEEKAVEREARKKDTVHSENETIDYISGNKRTEESIIALYQKSTTPQREKAISARVNGEIFEEFKKICKSNNMTTNAGLNMIIARYVEENQ